ncbi:MAG TPA: thiamine pyrophosphate-dependent enzyme, partial [Clostridiales bacterium]|nr:thiamine pyrophosphate-dependent enzyme [Clostridiales bacterium]
DNAQEMKAILDRYLATVSDGEANGEAAKALIQMLENSVCREQCDCCELEKEILEYKEYLNKKSIWIFGGDGWAYDIGFGGLDHVIASGEDVNIMVFDTEVYSNTGGQASKASQIGQVAQFAAAGKSIAKKSLSEIAMSYGYVYVAQIAMGADMNQTIKAINEAEAYNGPSLIIAYAPCEMHSIKGGMVNCQKEMKKAVECGYWNIFRYNPLLKEQGKNPLTIDNKPPTGSYRDFIMNEARYSALTRAFPERAKELFANAEKTAMDKYEHLLKLKEVYEPGIN